MKTNFVFVFLLSLSLALFSCEKNDTLPAEAETVSEDEALSEFLLLATLNTSAARPAVSPGSSSDSTSTGFGGKKCNLTETEVSALPETVTTYISTTYADATIERAGTTSQGEILVHIQKSDSTSAVLLFDASGNFVSEKTHKGGRDLSTPVKVSELPEAVPSYVSTNYSEATIEKAIEDEEGNYIVLAKKSDGTMVGLAFNAEGNFVSEVAMKGKFGGKGRSKKY